LKRATTAEEILGSPLTWEAAAQAFVQAFQSELNLELCPADLNPEELARARELMEEKYANRAWTGKF
ncbi:MAG: hypothetical protein JW963_15450, partial [Anaerolineales bacterium]|nr:hypothetical protein [Anaerolineales bacterium]